MDTARRMRNTGARGTGAGDFDVVRDRITGAGSEVALLWGNGWQAVHRESAKSYILRTRYYVPIPPMLSTKPNRMRAPHVVRIGPIARICGEARSSPAPRNLAVRNTVAIRRGNLGGSPQTRQNPVYRVGWARRINTAASVKLTMMGRITSAMTTFSTPSMLLREVCSAHPGSTGRPVRAVGPRPSDRCAPTRRSPPAPPARQRHRRSWARGPARPRFQPPATRRAAAPSPTLRSSARAIAANSPTPRRVTPQA